MPESNIGTMPQSFRGYIGLALEDSYGGGGAPDIFVDAMEDGFEYDNQTVFDDDTTRSRGRHRGELGPLSAEGSVDFPANPENGIGIILLGALGDEEFTTEETGEVGVHTFTPSDTLPSLSVQVGRDTDDVRNVGTGVDTLEMAHESEERLTWSADFISQKPVKDIPETAPTYSDLRNFWFHDGSLSIAGTDRMADVQEITPTVENELEPHYRANRVVDKLEVGDRIIQFEATLDFEDDALFRQMLGDPEASEPQETQEHLELEIGWTSPETIGTSSTQYSLEGTAPKCTVDTHNANLDGNELIAEEVTITALIDETLGHECEFVLKNGITESYANYTA